MEPRGYVIRKFPASRLATRDIGRLSRGRHHVAGFFEADVTEARRLIRVLVREGRDVGFMAWLAKEVSRALEAFPDMNAVGAGGRRRAVFRDVNLSLPIERTVDGEKVPLVKLIEKTDAKSVEDIHRELEEGRTRRIGDEKDFTLTARWYTRLNALFFRLPGFLRLAVWRLILLTPRSVHKNIGTAVVTNAGAVGAVPGWILPKTIHTLCFGLGTIVKKPRPAPNGETALRDILHLTVIADHDVVDGLPAAKFILSLVRNLEAAKELRELSRRED